METNVKKMKKGKQLNCYEKQSNKFKFNEKKKINEREVNY